MFRVELKHSVGKYEVSLDSIVIKVNDVRHPSMALKINILIGIEDGILGPTSDEDLPDFLLPDDSNKTRKLPYFQTGSAPKIFKSSLKDYHGLEGVRIAWSRISHCTHH